jgi:uncharacterized protein (DUF2236 family)
VVFGEPVLKEFIREQVRNFVGGNGKPPIQFLTPPGDPGLFGPHSMTWRVHADFVSMMIGGMSSLILQALHPQALAGVWDHSTFREDLRGRLNRTAFFIAATTYGSRELAESALKRVRDIHETVRGTTPEGLAYSATDPHLLYWVHLIETTSFLRAYETYVDPRLTQRERDQYFSEMRLIAEKLGIEADKTPHRRIAATAEEALTDIEAYRHELEFSERSRFVLQLLKDFPTPRSARPLAQMMIRAGLANLPLWAYTMIGEPLPSALERSAINTVVRAMAVPLRWALRNGVAAHAKRRMGMH